jgi:hypothetical protein
VYTKRNRSTEKLLMSLKVSTMMERIFWNLFHLLASLNSLSSLNVLSAVIAPLPELEVILLLERLISIIEIITIKQSKEFEAFIKYCLNPCPTSFRSISTQNIMKNARLNVSRMLYSILEIGYLSIDKDTMLPKMLMITNVENIGCIIILKHTLKNTFFSDLMVSLLI